MNAKLVAMHFKSFVDQFKFVAIEKMPWCVNKCEFNEQIGSVGSRSLITFPILCFNFYALLISMRSIDANNQLNVVPNTFRNHFRFGDVIQTIQWQTRHGIQNSFEQETRCFNCQGWCEVSSVKKHCKKTHIVRELNRIIRALPVDCGILILNL